MTDDGTASASAPGFDALVQDIGNATVESLLRSGGGLTIGTTARDAWIARTEDAVRRMISEQRVADSDVAAARAAAQRILRFAASWAYEQGRREIIEADIDAAMLRIRIWPFS
jgi:hypothetical protein